MTDLEKLKRCTERAGLPVVEEARFGGTVLWLVDAGAEYNPLTNKAQAFDLVEKERLTIIATRKGRFTIDGWMVAPEKHRSIVVHDPDLCRSIVECIAQIPSAE